MNQSTEQDLPSVLPTDRACVYINRSPQTLRKWACLDCAPMGIRPIRINGRLSWKVTDLMMILGVSDSSNSSKNQPESIKDEK
jgi:hypothetical protein